MSDNQVLFSCTIICIALITFSFRFSKRFALANTILFTAHSSLFYYNLFYNGQYGSSFTWWFYAVISTSLQITAISIYILYTLSKQKK